MNKKSVSWKVYGSFLLVFLALFYLSLSSYQSARHLAFDIETVDSSYSFIQQLHGLTSSLRDTEMTNNAYVLLGKEKYLNRYHQDVQTLGNRLMAIKQKKNAIYEKYGAELESLIAKKIENMDLAASEREKNGLNYALQVFLTGKWQKLTADIEKDLGLIEEEQKSLLNDQLGQKTKSIRDTKVFITLGIVASLILFFLATVIIRRDFLKRLSYEEKLELARAEAIRASEFKSQFLANMSHEIRTPMNGIMGMATVLLETKLDENQFKYAGIIKRSCEALLRIINDILDFSKVEAGKLDICPESFNLKVLLNEIESVFLNSTKQKGLEFTMQIDAQIPNGVVGDSGRIRQILNNLIGNAVKFTEKGSVTVVASAILIGHDACKMRFEIRDTGVGIGIDGQKKIFGAFEQGELNTGKRFGGTGLGLNISKKLVELMGGKIGFYSELGKGSTFWFSLDLAFTPKAVAVDEVKAHDPALPIPARRPLKALVADDDAVNQEVIVNYLQIIGIDAEIAVNGDEAVSKFSRAQYDLLLIDYAMPLMDGFQALERIRAMEAARRSVLTPAFLVTAADMGGHLARMQGLKVAGFINKPLHFESFKSLVTQSLIPAAATPPRSHKDAQPVRLLIADDSDVNQELLRIFLGRADFILDFTADGRAALELFKSKVYGLVLMDIQMPVLNGLDAVKLIRSWERERGLTRTPVLAFTAGVTDNEIKECKEAGCDGYISKPIERATLLTTVSLHLKNKLGEDQHANEARVS